jgi:surfeit locus 1 family protein
MHVRLELFREPDTAEVIGLALPAPRGRGDVDPRRLADSLPYAVAPWVVLELAQPGQASPRIFRWQPDPLDNGPHLLYAIQWFSFATIAIVGTFFLVRRNLAERSA